MHPPASTAIYLFPHIGCLFVHLFALFALCSLSCTDNSVAGFLLGSGGGAPASQPPSTDLGPVFWRGSPPLLAAACASVYLSLFWTSVSDPFGFGGVSRTSFRRTTLEFFHAGQDYFTVSWDFNFAQALLGSKGHVHEKTPEVNTTKGNIQRT